VAARLSATSLVRGLDQAGADRYAGRARDPAVLRGALNWYRAMPFSLREPAGPVQVPTMFVWGNRDRFVSRAAAGLCGRYVTGPNLFTIAAATEHASPPPADQIPITRNEIAALFRTLIINPVASSRHRLRWSTWRRRRQRRARACHYQRQAADDP
jgi:hypothetical protein